MTCYDGYRKVDHSEQTQREDKTLHREWVSIAVPHPALPSQSMARLIPACTGGEVVNVVCCFPLFFIDFSIAIQIVRIKQIIVPELGDPFLKEGGRCGDGAIVVGLGRVIL